MIMKKGKKGTRRIKLKLKTVSYVSRLCVCFTIKKKGHTRESLHWSDQQLNQCLPATFWLGLVNLQSQRGDV